LETGSNISQPAFSAEGEKAWLALLLGWVAGFADAFGYLVLNEIFTSHMSGNSVAAGAEVGRGHWAVAAQHAWPIVFFIFGFFTGLFLETVCGRLQIRRRLSATLILEIVLLAMFFFLGRSWAHSGGITPGASAKFYLLVALLAGAMGVQSASLRRVRGQSVHTSYVTGMLTHSVEYAVKALFAAYDRLRCRVTNSAREDVKLMIFYAGVWLSFTVGAVCGGIGESHWQFPSMLAPLAVLAGVIVFDLIRPIHD
jgi:uncharacterized membrane protein YoaK (UPF0700 family)